MPDKTIQLGDILTANQMQEVQKILDEPHQNDFDKSNKLKKYFDTFKDELAEKGVIPGYLAYAVVFQVYGQKNGHHG